MQEPHMSSASFHKTVETKELFPCKLDKNWISAPTMARGHNMDGYHSLTQKHHRENSFVFCCFELMKNNDGNILMARYTPDIFYKLSLTEV